MIDKEKIMLILDNDSESDILDYKKDLVLDKDGDKAEFVKDIAALANSGEISHIIIGVEDKTRKVSGFLTPHSPEQLNGILKDKCDPPIALAGC